MNNNQGKQQCEPVKGYDASHPELGLLEVVRTDKYGYVCKDAQHQNHDVWFCDMRILH